jgi:hypothetical protein
MAHDLQQLTNYFRAVCEAFGYCPTTARVVFSAKGDDKAFCGCGEHHLVRLLKPATAEDMAIQFQQERSN